MPVVRALLASLIGLAVVAFFDPSATYACLLGLAVAVSICVLPFARARGRVRTELPDGASVSALDAATVAVFEAMPEPVFLIDDALQLRYRNAVAERVFGTMTPGETIALRFRSPDFLTAVESAVASAYEGTAVLTEGRGAERNWTVDIRPIRPASGAGSEMFMLLFRDRTAERRIERMRTDFVANASHELRTPLASLIGFIETLQGPAREDAAARVRFLDIMREQAARMSRLIDDLLSLSRIEMKGHLPLGERIDLAELLEEVGEVMAPLLRESGMVADFDIAPGPHEIEGDRDELLQVFSNLVENACKYAAGGGRILLKLDTTGDDEIGFRKVSVTDFGPGIAAEHVPRLTERFYRVDVASSRAKRGTGLGLSIVRNILQRHSARLVIASEPGRGSTFAVVFPFPRTSGKNL